MVAISTESSKTASLKSALPVVMVTSNVLNKPATSEMPMCVMLKVNFECHGSDFQAICANSGVHNKATTKNDNTFS